MEWLSSIEGELPVQDLDASYQAPFAMQHSGAESDARFALHQLHHLNQQSQFEGLNVFEQTPSNFIYQPPNPTSLQSNATFQIEQYQPAAYDDSIGPVFGRSADHTALQAFGWRPRTNFNRDVTTDGRHDLRSLHAQGLQTHSSPLAARMSPQASQMTDVRFLSDKTKAQQQFMGVELEQRFAFGLRPPPRQAETAGMKRSFESVAVESDDNPETSGADRSVSQVRSEHKRRMLESGMSNALSTDETDTDSSFYDNDDDDSDQELTFQSIDEARQNQHVLEKLTKAATQNDDYKMIKGDQELQRTWVRRILRAFDRDYQQLPGGEHDKVQAQVDEWVRFQDESIKQVNNYLQKKSTNPDVKELKAWNILRAVLKAHEKGLRKTSTYTTKKSVVASQRLSLCITAIADLPRVRFDLLKGASIHEFVAHPEAFARRKCSNLWTNLNREMKKVGSSKSSNEQITTKNDGEERQDNAATVHGGSEVNHDKQDSAAAGHGGDKHSGIVGQYEGAAGVGDREDSGGASDVTHETAAESVEDVEYIDDPQTSLYRGGNVPGELAWMAM